MRRLFCYSALCIGLTSIAGSLLACEVPQEMKIEVNPIFDESNPDTNWIHRIANKLHINTKQATLENDLSFLSPCETDPKVLYEAERYLRSLRYLRDATVRLENSEESSRIHIQTWDTWSLLPTLDFGRKGGQNQFEIGLKDSNLFGLGIDSEVSYFSNPQRQGYKLDSKFPVYLGKNMNAHLRLIDSPDGDQQSLYLRKPMITLKSEFGGTVGFNQEDRIDTIFHNEHDEYQFRHDITQVQAELGFKLYDTENEVFRLLAGVVTDEHSFSENDSVYLPADRKFMYPWVGGEWLQDEFVTLKNLHLIEQNEDINLGWHVSGGMGVNMDDETHANALIWHYNVTKGFVLNDKTLFLTELKGKGFSGGDNGEGSSITTLNSELLYRYNPRWALFGDLKLQYGHNPLLDLPLALGGDTNLRGFPLQYQHGNRSVLLNTELRYYPQINLFQLFELGGAVFYDIGKASGDAPISNTDDGWLQSVGIGARLYLAHSSERQVIHIDLAHPISDQSDVSNLELRIEVKKSF
ncbi:ShlB/FhaC/HecB family hemolysin secretion/activation protein [Alteromonas facilis]|uniref:ShlB/FhaC/HecB family hemolysin secretion/activation protein n=1 Tax=Alteromonas facilis TaxID=2048004 RepID=UPI000C285E02|nr:ShlB/FhaC/HecB family hemolysin secretion/activation protein [Alteromonas facilis]